MATQIITKNSAVASAVPTAGDLVQGELAINVTDKRLFTEDSGGSIIELSTPSIVDNGNATAITIDASENVGIGTATPDGILDLTASGNTYQYTQSTTAANALSFFKNSAATSGGYVGLLADGTFRVWNSEASDALAFGTADTERMRIDASGNLLVGQSATVTPGLSNTTTGLSLTGSGYVFASKDNDNAAWFNRNSSDGSIVSFRKDGATVGSIGTDGRFYIDGASDGTGIYFGGSGLLPRDAGAIADAAVSLGGATQRFTDLHLSGGVYLGGTAAANLLDDYEDFGTFAPTFTPATSGTLPLVGSQSLLGYTKIGSTVTITGLVAVSSPSSPTGDTITMSGLPFQIGNGTELSGRAGPVITVRHSSVTVNAAVPCTTAESTTTLLIRLDASLMQNGDQFYINFTYYTDQ